MKNKYKILIVIIVLILATVACGYTSDPTVKEGEKVQQQQELFQRSQPVPSYDFSLERDIMIQLYNMRNEAPSTYSVALDNHGGVVFACPSIGYPIPYSTQLTSPDQIVKKAGESGSGYYYFTMPQAEPNGLYSPADSFGTWMTCVMTDGTVYPFYTELNVQTWPFPVKQVKSPDTGAYVFVPVEGAKPAKTLKIEKSPAHDPKPEPTWTVPAP